MKFQAIKCNSSQYFKNKRSFEIKNEMKDNENSIKFDWILFILTLGILPIKLESNMTRFTGILMVTKI